MDNFLEQAKQSISLFFTNIAEILASIGGAQYYTLVVRWILPVLALTIFFRCIIPLLQNGKRSSVWGYLCMTDGTRIPLKHWENSIGRSKLSDIILNLSFVSRSHAVLTLNDGIWTVADLGSK